MGKNDFYVKATPSFSPYGSAGTEPDMRQEFINTMTGKYPEVAKSQPALIRRMRRTNGNLIACGCVDTITKEPDKDRFCPICYGEGYLWDEEDALIYRVLEDSDTDNALRDQLQAPGLINIPIIVFYIRYDSNITNADKIVRLVLDDEGDVVLPIQRYGIYRINASHDFRADNGKLEYWKIFTHFESVKYLNAPNFEDL